MSAVATPAPPPPVVSHATPAAAAGAGTLIGILTTLAGLFDIPATAHGAQSDVTITGPILIAVSILSFIASHLGLSKASIARDVQLAEQEWPTVQAALGQLDQLPEIHAAVAEAKSIATVAKGKAEALEAKLPAGVSADLEGAIEAAIEKRFAGLLKALGAQTAEPAPTLDPAAAGQAS